jgi:hypothetical protein
MTAWKNSKNRGFYYGPEYDTPWNWDLMWKRRVDKENINQERGRVMASFQLTEDAPVLPPLQSGRVSGGSSRRSRLGSRSVEPRIDGEVLASLERERLDILRKEKDIEDLLRKDYDKHVESEEKIKMIDRKLNVILETLAIPPIRYETKNAAKSFNTWSLAQVSRSLKGRA